MWSALTLRGRIYLVLIALVGVTTTGGLVMIWYTYQMSGIFNAITNEHLPAFQSAASLEVALVNQKGFVSYYFQDGDPTWLKQLGEYRQIFKDQLEKAKRLVVAPSQKRALVRIESEYQRYTDLKDQVIDQFKAGQRQLAAKLNTDVRLRFFKIMDLCEAYKKIQVANILQEKQQSQKTAVHLRYVGALAVLTCIVLALWLVLIFIHQILGPAVQLVQLAGSVTEAHPQRNVMAALSQTVHGLMENVGQTQQELERSRETLLQAEKMALVGRLAAGMAHSIRNPFTSVKMRLFSLGRSLDMNEQQKEDFDVISDEIRHIDTIVQNFLEFSRPPKLKMQQVSPSTVVDMVVQLLIHRLQSYEVEVKIDRPDALPAVQADPEQLKEVLVNLVINACEAMQRGGRIVISEQLRDGVRPNEAVIRLTDSGPGISDNIKGKIFQPFFTTKEQGTGLGLSIAARIIAEHHGRLEVDSRPGQGTTFILSLPLKE